MRRVALLAAVSVAALVFGMVGVLLADTTHITDPNGDNLGSARRDLQSAQAGHVGAKRRGGTDLEHRASVRGRAIGSQPPEILINTPGHGPGPEYRVARSRSGHDRVVDLKDAGYGGDAEIVKEDRNTFAYRFSDGLIGCPAHYGWQVVYRSPVKVYDRAPDHGYVTHDLTQPKAAKRWVAC